MVRTNYNTFFLHSDRSMWANMKYLPHFGMKTVFVVAIPQYDDVQELLEVESKIHHDIIQLDFLDAYGNLTLKTLSILHWTKTFCPQAKWILKSDTDVFVNPFALTQYLNETEADFVCKVCYHCRVCRAGTHCPPKWFVSREEYPDEYYPTYCLGSAYVLRANLANKIYALANKTHPLIIEDAYFTGILTKNMNVSYDALRGAMFLRGANFLPRYVTNNVIFMLADLIRYNIKISSLWNNLAKNNIQQYNHTYIRVFKE